MCFGDTITYYSWQGIEDWEVAIQFDLKAGHNVQCNVDIPVVIKNGEKLYFNEEVISNKMCDVHKYHS